MIRDELGAELHDRYSLDEPLTPQEQAQLEAWYAQKDSAEAALLEQNQPQLPNLTMCKRSWMRRLHSLRLSCIVPPALQRVILGRNIACFERNVV